MTVWVTIMSNWVTIDYCVNSKSNSFPASLQVFALTSKSNRRSKKSHGIQAK